MCKGWQYRLKLLATSMPAFLVWLRINCIRNHLRYLQLLNLDRVAMMFLVKSPNIFHHETWSAWFR